MAALVADASGSLDVIIAPATPPGVSALAIVRLTGPAGDTLAVARRLAPSLPERPAARQARTCRLVDDRGSVLDHAMVLFFEAPRSSTGEEVVELFCHGSPGIVAAVLRAGRLAGARPARPGEFTRRALANGRVDLAQAEGVSLLTRAESRGEARRALGLVDGDLSVRIREVRERLLALLVEVEAALDFTEDVGLPEERLQEDLRAVGGLLARLVASTAVIRGSRLPIVVISGPPNAGKSTLFNALLGEDRAIVTATPGTTRDALAEELELEGERIRLVDTAGLRMTEYEVVALGVATARRAAAGADLVLAVVELGAAEEEKDPAIVEGCPPRIVVASKRDLGGERPEGVELWVSARTGEGLPELLALVARRLGLVAAEGSLAVLERHREALERAAREVGCAREESGKPEVLAASLRRALHALSEITGETTTEELLDRIFSTFCIGK